MKFKITKSLKNGKYLVNISMTEFTDEDKNKAQKHGFPSLIVRDENGREVQASSMILNQLKPFPFFTREDADEYYNNVKNQLLDIKTRWDLVKDEWSTEEEI